VGARSDARPCCRDRKVGFSGEKARLSLSEFWFILISDLDTYFTTKSRIMALKLV